MKGFNEMSHAYIAARFYQLLVEKFGDRGVKAFNHGTQYYGTQRGRRMAQRAIRNGKDLTYETYCQYGEWENTEFAKSKGIENQTDVISTSPDFHMEIRVCPWHELFKEIEEVEGGHEYCKYLDASIARGFNPDLVYEVPETLHKSDKCTQIIRDVNFDENTDTTKKMEYVKDFDYHCAHSFWAYSEVVEGIFGLEGREISTKVLEDFGERYGREAADIIMKYKYTNFNVTY